MLPRVRVLAIALLIGTTALRFWGEQETLASYSDGGGADSQPQARYMASVSEIQNATTPATTADLKSDEAEMKSAANHKTETEMINPSSRGPKFLWGILSMDSTKEMVKRQVIRETYLSYDNSNTENRICSLPEYRNWKKQGDTEAYDSCEFIYAFVVGSNPQASPTLCNITDSTYPLAIDAPTGGNLTTETDLVHLNIRENMNEGKSPSWFKYGVSLIDQEGLDFDYIAKVDTDTVLNPENWFDKLKEKRVPNPAGKALVYGGAPSPATSLERPWLKPALDFWMQGGLYFLSVELARYIASPEVDLDALEDYKYRPEYDLNGIGHEDLSMSNFVFSHPKHKKIKVVRFRPGLQGIGKHPMKEVTKFRRFYTLASRASRKNKKMQDASPTPSRTNPPTDPPIPTSPTRASMIPAAAHNNRKLANSFDSLKAYEYPAPAGMEPETLLECFKKQNAGVDPQVDSNKLILERSPFFPKGYLPQDMGDWFLHKQMKNSTRVTTNPSEADTFIINTMPVLSYQVGDCAGMSHSERQQKWIELLNASQYFQSRPKDHAYTCQSWTCFSAVVPEMWKLIAPSSALLTQEAILPWFRGKKPRRRAKAKAKKTYEERCKVQPPYAVIVPYVAHSFIGAQNNTVHQQKQHKVTFLGSYKRRSEWRDPIADPQVQELLYTQHIGVEKKTNHGASDEDFQMGYAQAMANSDFCLVPAGDTASSRRLFDAMMAGCIPVFIGPKYNRPFENLIPYEEFSVQFNSTQWLPKGGAHQCIKSLYEAFSQERIIQMRQTMSQYSLWADWRHGDGVLQGILSNMELKKQSLAPPVEWKEENASVKEQPKITKNTE